MAFDRSVVECFPRSSFKSRVARTASRINAAGSIRWSGLGTPRELRARLQRGSFCTATATVDRNTFFPVICCSIAAAKETKL